MTEKRFRISQGYTDRFCHDWQNNQLLNFRETVDLLNELAEENQDNKAMIEFLSTENTQIMNELKTRTQIQHQLEEENEQLKLQNSTLMKEISEYSRKAKELEKKVI